MQSTIFNIPVIKVKSLESKFDTTVLSNSFVALLDNNYIEARILQQLHYWCYSEYGVVIDGIRWIYKPIREWLSEALIGFTEWKLRGAIASLLRKGLIRREKLFTKHQIQNGDRFWWQPKNQTYYYSLNYDRLQELIEQVENKENAESTENVRFENSTKLSIEAFQDTKSCDCPQNRSKNTSIENKTKDQSHPTLPCEWEIFKADTQEKELDSNPELLTSQEETNKASYKVIEQDTISEDVEENINQYKDTNELAVQENVQERSTVQETVQIASATKSIVKPKTPRGTKPKRKDKAPWKDEGQFKRFYRALIQALPIVANAHSPQGLAQTIIRQLRCGIPHSYWDDFINGLPIGASTKPEWEIEPGVPYPMFIEYLTEKIKAGNNTQSDEQTRNEVFRILNKPRQAKAFWGQFKRSVVNVSEQVERARALGVSNPSTPVWTRERIEPSIEEAEEAGEKIMAVNSTSQAAIEAAINPQLESVEPLSNQLSEPPISDPWTEDNQPLTIKELLSQSKVKGFGLAMPKVSSEKAEAEARAESEALRKQQMNRQTHINQMSIDEINELLTDPIVRKELTSQIIINNKFDVITDNLGEVLAVKISQEYLDSGGT